MADGCSVTVWPRSDRDSVPPSWGCRSWAG